jgi:hypothetical protein
MSKDKLPNPFESARRMPGITVQLDPHDIIARNPGMTAEQADDLLNRHGHEIAGRMIRAGVDAARALHRGEGGGHDVQ